MLDLGWGEILVIAIVLILVVGPKDLPRVLRTFGRTMTKLRSMAGEFRSQFDEALKEAELDDVRKTVNDARSLNPARELRDALNPLKQAGDDLRSDINKAMRDKPTVAQKDPSAPAPGSDAANPAPASTPPAVAAASSAAASGAAASTSSTSASSAAAVSKPEAVAKPVAAAKQVAPAKSTTSAKPAASASAAPKSAAGIAKPEAVSATTVGAPPSSVRKPAATKTPRAKPASSASAADPKPNQASADKPAAAPRVRQAAKKTGEA
jgi:sec-independent protein translocase protein TatB